MTFSEARQKRVQEGVQPTGPNTAPGTLPTRRSKRSDRDHNTTVITTTTTTTTRSRKKKDTDKDATTTTTTTTTTRSRKKKDTDKDATTTTTTEHDNDNDDDDDDADDRRTSFFRTLQLDQRHVDDTTAGRSVVEGHDDDPQISKSLTAPQPQPQ